MLQVAKILSFVKFYAYWRPVGAAASHMFDIVAATIHNIFHILWTFHTKRTWHDDAQHSYTDPTFFKY
jgi:hypothetical protein